MAHYPSSPGPGGGGGGGPVTVADGADTCEGALADVAVTTDADGSLSAKLRGLIVVLLRAFALATPLRIDPVGSTSQPVTANTTQLNSQTIALNAGTASAGTQRVVQASAAVHNVTQVSVPTTAGGIAIIAANPNRIKVRVINTSTNPVWIGPNSTPTTGNGAFIPGIAGYPWTSRYEGALYAISTGGTALVTVDEEASV